MASHRSGQVFRISNQDIGKGIVGLGFACRRRNGRGPYAKGRIVDLSEGAARELGARDKGVLLVRLEVISAAQPVEPS